MGNPSLRLSEVLIKFVKMKMVSELFNFIFICPSLYRRLKCMGECFQDYSRIQDFEADFP